MQCCGHGKPVKTADGDWYMVYLCSRGLKGENGEVYSIIGRETALDPITWTADGWPVVNKLKGPSCLQVKPKMTKPGESVLSDSLLTPELRTIYWSCRESQRVTGMGRMKIKLFFLVFFLCGCTQAKGLTSTDWFVYDGEFYVKTGEDVYEKRELPRAVSQVLQDGENTDFFLIKEENKLVMESETDFYIYDFTKECMERHNTEYGHLGWQIFQNKIYYIENSDNDQTTLMVYDMASGIVNEIDTGEYMPVQFCIRRDGAIGMWGENARGEKEYCFLESMAPIYVLDQDKYFGWTYLYGFTERGIILEREYPTSTRQGTKIYGVTKDGEVSTLAGTGEGDNLRAIPEGGRIFAEDKFIAVDLLCGLAEAYDYEFCYRGELQWDIGENGDMVFMGYFVQGEDVWGIWQTENDNSFKLGLLIQDDTGEDTGFANIGNFHALSTEQQGMQSG